MTKSQNRSMTLSRLMADFAHIEEGENVAIRGLSMDSRTVEPGELFLACRSVDHGAHGSAYSRMALERGAAAVAVDVDDVSVADDALKQLSESFSRPVIRVERLDQKAGYLAANFYGQASGQLAVFGVTGTNGKTSVSQFLAQCISALGRPCGVIGTLGSGVWGHLSNTGFTTPLAVAVHKTMSDLQQQGVSDVVMEVSSHGLEQGRVNGVLFDVAILTNLSRDHLDYHGSMDNYAAAKSLLFKQPGLSSVVLNLDDDFGRNLCREVDTGVLRVGYSLELAASEQVDKLISARVLSMSHQGVELAIESPWGKGLLRSRLLGRFNAQNLLAVLGALLASEVPFEQALSLVSTVEAPTGRMETFERPSYPVVVVDYAHTPDALENVLATLREHCQGEVWVVFGCGGDRDKGKRPQMGAIAEAFANHVVVTDDNPRSEDAHGIVEDILKGIKNVAMVLVEHDREAAIRKAIHEAKEQDMVLIAGKGHEDYQIVGAERRHFSDREVVRSVLGEAA